MTTEPTNTVEQTSEPIGLQVIDIENAVKAIDYASDQGAYKGWPTIQEVLNIRNRLVQFLQQAKVEIEAAQAAEAAALAAASPEASVDEVPADAEQDSAEGAA